MKKNRVSMRWKIQKSMMVILAVTLVLSYAILSVILYNRNLALLQAELQQEVSGADGSGGSSDKSDADRHRRISAV